jgi:peroxiredoxin Q/BCP
MLKAGEQAPEFRLKSDEGKEIALSDFKGRHVVLFFFPKANTPG